MRNIQIAAGLLCLVPLAATLAVAQEKPDAPSGQKPAPPALEKPGTAAPAPTKATKAMVGENARVVEEIIARVNNEIITRSEYDKARASAAEDARQECGTRCTPEQLTSAVEGRQKNTLRDLIDQSLLVQRGKDMGVSVETEVIKRLDQIRIDNKLASMEELEQAVSKQGMNWEDFKSNIRSGLLTQRVIGSEVGSHINVPREEAEKYYNEHKQEFVRPEQVALREILVSTDAKKESELPDLKKRAETALKRVQDGEDFGEIAKRLSDGGTKAQGGYLGMFKRGELSPQLEETVFKMKRNELTPVLETKQGYLVLQVMEHYDEGQQSLDKVVNEIMSKLYDQRMEPAVREYLKTLREQSYVIIKPGYTEVAGGSSSEIQEISATPEVTKEKKGRKKFLLFGKRNG